MVTRQPLATRPARFAAPALAFLTVLLALSACSSPDRGEADFASTADPGAAGALDLPAGAQAAADSIDRDTLHEVVAELAGDHMEGRGPGTAGDVLARDYIAEQLARAGAQPGGDGGSWEQAFDIVGVTAEVPATWTFERGGEQLSLSWWQDFIAGVGDQEASAGLHDAELVFVGYGIEAPEYDWDDYKGESLAGKVLVMLNNDPDWDDALFAGERRLYYGRWTYKYESAARQGAAGAIIIHTDRSAGYGWNVIQSSWSGTQFELPRDGEARLPIPAWTSWPASERLWQLAGRDLAADLELAKGRDFRPIPLGIRTSLSLEARLETTPTANVLGLIPGADPALRDQVVIYTAHHDHYGRGEPDETGDDIYNGALDNAAGVAEVLAIARAFQYLPTPPRRSILFLLVAAEEQGLLGSRYYAAHPTFAPGRIAANLNFDGGNIWGPARDLIYIGYGKSDLDQVVEAAAAMQGRYVVGDQFPDKGYFYRSDQFSLAQIGVPAIYLDGGTDLVDAPRGEAREKIEAWTATHYHQPSDELTEAWRFEGMIDDTRVGFFAGLHIANADALPAWNAGDEFEAARLQALDEIAAAEAQ